VNRSFPAQVSPALPPAESFEHVFFFVEKSFHIGKIALKLSLGHGISPLWSLGVFVEQPVCHDHLFKSFSFAELSAHYPCPACAVVRFEGIDISLGREPC
jgi:hypothetical protein